MAFVLDVGDNLVDLLKPLVTAGAAGLAAWAASLKVKRELKPNGGATMRDAIDRIEERQQLESKRTDIALRGIAEKLQDVNVRQTTQHRESQLRLDDLEREQRSRIDALRVHVDEAAAVITGETPTLDPPPTPP